MVSAGNVGGTRGSGILSSRADVIGMSVVGIVCTTYQRARCTAIASSYPTT